MRNGLGWIGAAAVLALLYFPSLRGGFVYDDQWMIVTNPSIRQIQPLRFILDPGTVAAPSSGLSFDVYRPLTTLSFAVDYHLWGLRPLMYRVENLLLHLLNGWFFWLLIRKLLKDDAIAWAAAACFLFHPLQVQSVAWITQRSGLLSASCMLGALLVLLRKTDAKSLVLSGFLFLFGLLTKEVAIVLPALLWLCWQVEKKSPARRRQGQILALLAGVAGLFLLLRFGRLQHWGQVAGAGPSRALGLLAFPVYLAKMLLPMALRASYDFPTITLPRVLGGALFLIAWLAVAAELWRKNRPLAVGMVWILAALLPVLQLIPVRAFLAERFAYVPLMGFALAAGSYFRRSRRRAIPYIFWICFLAVMTARAVPAWSSEYALWSYAVRMEPTNAFAHACLGQASRNPSEAEAQYRLVLSNRPSRETLFGALNNLAWLALRKNNPAEGAVWAEQALSISPSDPQALYNAAQASLQLGKTQEAEKRIKVLEGVMGREHPMVRALRTYKRSRR